MLGADNAACRLRELCAWFREVQNAGGYRKYYAADPKRGTLQGANVAGGLGLDKEFVESVLPPSVMIYGFLGLRPTVDGLEINPKLPIYAQQNNLLSPTPNFIRVSPFPNVMEVEPNNDQQTATPNVIFTSSLTAMSLTIWPPTIVGSTLLDTSSTIHWNAFTLRPRRNPSR